MSTATAHLARIFTPTYARHINAQMVYPASKSLVVKPNELYSALARPQHVEHYEPDRSARYVAATLAYGIIKGHPFMDGNKRTAFYLANEYLRIQGLPDLFADSTDPSQVAERFMNVASGEMDVEGLANENE